MTQEPPLFAEFTGTAPRNEKINRNRPTQSGFTGTAPRQLIKDYRGSRPLRGAPPRALLNQAVEGPYRVIFYSEGPHRKFDFEGPHHVILFRGVPTMNSGLRRQPVAGIHWVGLILRLGGGWGGVEVTGLLRVSVVLRLPPGGILQVMLNQHYFF